MGLLSATPYRLIHLLKIGRSLFPNLLDSKHSQPSTSLLLNIFLTNSSKMSTLLKICENDPESHLRPLTSEECCALRYVAGYTFRKVYSSIDLSTHPQKDVMMCLLMDLVGDGVSSSSESERWMGMIYRGGLWTINDQACDIFLIMHGRGDKEEVYTCL